MLNRFTLFSMPIRRGILYDTIFHRKTHYKKMLYYPRFSIFFVEILRVSKLNSLAEIGCKLATEQFGRIVVVRFPKTVYKISFRVNRGDSCCEQTKAQTNSFNICTGNPFTVKHLKANTACAGIVALIEVFTAITGKRKGIHQRQTIRIASNTQFLNLRFKKGSLF